MKKMGKIIFNRNKCMLCNKETKPLFTFPKNPDRFSLWFKSILKEDLLYSMPRSYLVNNARLCNLHFKDDDFTSTFKNVLLRFAVPQPLKASDQVSLTNSLDCQSSSSSCSKESECSSSQEANFSSSQTVKNTAAPSSKTSVTAVDKVLGKSPTICRVVMTNLSSPGVVEDPFVTVITLCCTDIQEGISFHSFLLDREQRIRWILDVRRKNFKPSLISILCPKHFNEDQTHRHSTSKVKLKENTVPNTFSSDPLSHQEDENLLQWEEVIPMDHQDATTEERTAELHCNPSKIKKFYVKVIWNKSVSKITKRIHSLPVSTIPTTTSNPSKHLLQTNRKELIHVNLAKKKCKKDFVYSNSDSRSKNIMNLQTDLTDSKMERTEIGHTDVRTVENESNNSINGIEEGTDVRMGENNLIDSPIGTASSNIESNNSIITKENAMDSNTSHCDTEMERKINGIISPQILNLEGGVDPFSSQKVTKIEEVKSYAATYIAVPNEWWGITHTPQYIVCSKWNEFYDPVFRVIIENDCSLKVFIKGRECVNENRKVSLENISSVLHEIDSYQICAGVDDKSMTYCLGRLENGSQQRFSIWCKGCQRRGEELMKNYRSLK